MTIEEKHDILVEKLSALINKKGNRLDGWFSDTVELLLDGEVVNNICIDGKWQSFKFINNELVQI